MESKNIKKWLKKLLITNAVFVAVVIAGYFVFQSKYVQTYVISLITKVVSQSTGTEISIKRVDIALFRKVILDDVYLSDEHGDTLLFVDKMITNIDSLSVFKKKIYFKNISFNEPVINIEKIDSTYNFSFLFSDLSFEGQDAGWRAFCSSFKVKDGKFIYNDISMDNSLRNFMKFKNLNFSLDSIQVKGNKFVVGNLDNFQIASENGIRIKDLSTKVTYADSVLSLNSLLAKTVYSYLKIDSMAINFTDYLNSKSITEIGYYAKLDSLDFAFKDVSFLLESFTDNDFRAYAKGVFKGTIDNIKGKDVVLKVGEFTQINADFDINGLPDLEHTYLFVNLEESYANLDAIRFMDLPVEVSEVVNGLPAFLFGLGEFTYTGNFSGFFDDFVAYGTAYSSLGKLKSDLAVKPLSNHVVKLDGHLSTQGLNIGSLFSNPELGQLTLSGAVQGKFNTQSNDFDIEIDGNVDSIDYREYKYQNIQLNGNLRNKLFNGALKIDDPNLKMEYSGKLDLMPQLPVFEFYAAIEHANLNKLHLSGDSISLLSANVNANFVGNNIDNVLGEIQLNNLRYKNHIDSLNVSKVLLVNSPQGKDSSFFFLSSDLINAEIRGKYNFIDLKNSLVKFYSYYFPSVNNYVLPENSEVNQFSFFVNVEDIKPITKMFAPQLEFKRPFNIKGSFNSVDQTATVEASIPFVRLNSKEFENIKLSFEADSQKVKGKIKSSNIHIVQGLNFSNLTVETEGKNDKLAVNFFYNNNGVKTYSGSCKTLAHFSKTHSKYPRVDIEIEPSQFYFADSLWTLSKSNISIDTTSVAINKMKLKYHDKYFLVDGKISENSNDVLDVAVQNIDFNMLEPLMSNNTFNGIINAKAKISDLYKQFRLDLNLVVNDLTLEQNGLLGDLSVSSKWNKDTEKLESEVYLVKNDVSIVSAKGYIDPINAMLDLNLKFDKSPFSILQVLLPDVFYNQDGLGSGEVRLYGNLGHFKHDGAIYPVGNASFGITPLQTTYFTTNPVYFNSDSILFRNMNFTDKFGNKGVFYGYLKHTNFDSIKFEMGAKASNLLVMNTTSADNEQFYGTAFATGTVSITGEGDNVVLAGNVKSTKGTNINIPFETSESAVQYDFVKFVQPQTNVVKPVNYKVVTEGLTMDLDVDVTPDAKVQIIFNSQVGDVIKGEGSGNLQVKMDKNFNIQLYGNYTIEKGDYLFTLQNVINKRFTIENGGTLKWVGDPYNALIDISAVYRVKTSLYDLLVNNDGNIDLSKRIPVNCIIKLTDNLMQPKIDFDIELPTSDEQIRDQVDQVIVTQEDINKQMISLLLMGRFYTPEFFTGTPSRTTGADLVGATTTELLSNQLSNWISDIIEVFDIGINYRPGNDITNEQIELALSTQIFNDRVTIDGNVANNIRQSASKNTDFIGDLDVKVKLTKNGKLQLKGYTHSNDDLIFDTAPNTQGIGISYREEFDSFGELFGRITSIFKKKQKKDDIKKEEQEVPMEE